MRKQSGTPSRRASRLAYVRQWLCSQLAPAPVVTPIQLERLEDRILLSASPLAGAMVDADVLEPPPPADADNAALEMLSGAIAQLEAEAVAHAEAEHATAEEALDEVHETEESRDDEEPSTDDESTRPTLELVFIDIDAENFDELVADLMQQDGNSRRFEVHLLSNARDGIEQISEILAGRSGVDAIHLVSHGTEGRVNLGNTWLDADNLDRYTNQIGAWNDSLRSDADLLFYGCQLASNANGQELLASLGVLCDCDVAASDDDTGHDDLGGDWELE